MTVNAIAYVRRSQKSKKEERTVSLAEQEAQIRAYCQREGLTAWNPLHLP